jgi:hypothetical protein
VFGRPELKLAALLFRQPIPTPRVRRTTEYPSFSPPPKS